MQSFVFGEHEYSKQNSTQFIHRSCSILGLCPDEPILSWKYPKPKMHPTHRSPQLGLAYLRRAQNRSLQLSKILWDKGDFYDKAVTFSFVEHHTQSDKENDRECISCLPWWPGADRELTGSCSALPGIVRGYHAANHKPRERWKFKIRDCPWYSKTLWQKTVVSPPILPSLIPPEFIIISF